MIVTDEDYLVGKVVEVNFFTSRVLLISDINSKIPVSLQPGDLQAILSGKEKESGILQYTKGSSEIDNTEEILVLTSGAGGVFKSGIPVGKIIKKNYVPGEDIVVNFYKDFSQLKYVKIVSFLKETKSLDQSSKKDSNKFNEAILERNQQKEALKILIEQKKIAEEIRITIEEDNNILRNKIIRLQNELLTSEKKIKEIKIS